MILMLSDYNVYKKSSQQTGYFFVDFRLVFIEFAVGCCLQ